MTRRQQTELRDLVETTYNRLVSQGMITHSADTINYTSDFTTLYGHVQHLHAPTRNRISVILINLRKQGKCPSPRRKAKATS